MENESKVPEQLRDIWMDLDEAKGVLKFSRDTILRKSKDGVLTSIKYGRRTFISRESVKKYLNLFRHVER